MRQRGRLGQRREEGEERGDVVLLILKAKRQEKERDRKKRDGNAAYWKNRSGGGKEPSNYSPRRHFDGSHFVFCGRGTHTHTHTR